MIFYTIKAMALSSILTKCTRSTLQLRKISYYLTSILYKYLQWQIVYCHKEKTMKGIITAVFLFLTISGCASVGAAIDTVRNVAATAVDTTVQGAANIASAVAEDVVDTTSFVIETTAGVIDEAAKKVDEETDALSVEKPDFPTGELKE